MHCDVLLMLVYINIDHTYRAQRHIEIHHLQKIENSEQK